MERRLGEAETLEEQAVEAAIASIPGWAGRPARYQRLFGGISNANWRVTLDGTPQRYFLKIPGAGTEMFVDRLAAHRAASQAHAIGLGPKVFHFDPASGIEVSAFLDGYRACTNADFQSPDIQHAAVACYRRLHESPPFALTKTVFDMVAEHIGQIASLGGKTPRDWPFLLRAFEDARRAFLASGLDLVACFNDPMPGNFLISDGGPMQLVDFEFASSNERAYELGVWLGEMFYPEDVSAALIEAYAGALRPDFVARVTVMRAIADIKWACWAMVQECISALEFDYHKYGAWKFMRARSVIHDPRWERWLRTL
ncbi:MAG: phosphotransferase [Pseudomonadota bacterium]